MDQPIEIFRRRKGVSQSAMAKELGVSQGTISKWCTGEHFPPPRRLPSIAAYFGVDPLELFPDDVISPEVRALLIKTRNLNSDDVPIVEQLIDALTKRSAA